MLCASIFQINVTYPCFIAGRTSSHFQLICRHTEQAQHEAVRTKKLGKLKYEPTRPDVLLSDEIPDSLRQMPAEASLLSDRFHSMQESGYYACRSLFETAEDASTTTASTSTNPTSTMTTITLFVRQLVSFCRTQARNLLEVRKAATKKRKTNRMAVTRESCKDTRYKSPHFKGELPPWL